MATGYYGWDDTFVAAEAIAQWRVVLYSTTDDHVTLPAAALDAHIAGIAQEAAVASGDTIRVRFAGKSKVEVGTAATPGEVLAIHDTVGRAGVPTTAYTSGDGILGFADETASASGDIIACWLEVHEECV